MKQHHLLLASAPILCAAIMVHATEAMAQEPTATQILQKAYKAYVNKNYKQALLLYKDAHAISPNPGTLLAIALCHEKMNNPRVALKVARRAKTQVDSKSSLSPRIDKTIARLQQQVAALDKVDKLTQQASTAYAMANFDQSAKLYLNAYGALPRAIFLHEAAKARQKQGQLNNALLLAERAKAQETQSLNAKQAKANNQLIDALKQTIEAQQWETQRVGWKTYAGASAAGVGVILVSVALGYHGRTVRNHVDEAERIKADPTQNKRFNDLETETERLRAQGWTLLGIGSVLGVAGTGLLIWDLATVDRVRKPKATTQLSVQHNQMTLTARF